MDAPADSVVGRTGNLGIFTVRFARNALRSTTGTNRPNESWIGMGDKRREKLGRAEAAETTQAVQKFKAQDMTQAKVAGELKISIATVKRHWNKT
jgi:hypothetical protein